MNDVAPTCLNWVVYGRGRFFMILLSFHLTHLFYCSLNACKLTANCCEQLAKSISSSQLRELDLSNNNLTDVGIAKLSDGLRNSKLETLRSVSNHSKEIKSFIF